MKIIVVHDKYSNEPIIINTSAINAIRKAFDETDKGKKEYSEIWAKSFVYPVKESIGAVMMKIKKAESEE